MKLPALCALTFLLAAAPVVEGQVADRCVPGWSMLNRLREQLTPEISPDTLKLLRGKIEKALANCRDIPDLWYYRALVAERLRDDKDAAYSRKQAGEGNSEALRANANPFLGVRETPAAALSSRIGEKYALVVGIDEFQNVRPLHSAVNDARSVAELLSNQQMGRFEEKNVTSLLNQNATLTGMRTAIGRIRARAKPDDLVVIYIASHGSPREMDPNGVSYVIMHDTKIDTAENLYATSLQMIDLVETLKRDVQARRVVLILDTCFSGDATGARGVMVHSADKTLGPESEFSAAVDKFEDKTSKGAARAIISASRASEESREDDKLGHGYFTYFLLESLKKNGGGSPLSEVFQSVHDSVSKAVHDRYGVSQTPTMRSTPEGLNVVLGAPAGGQ